MDKMLYIIVGLVVIVIIAVLVMRKNKAQKPSQQSSLQNNKANSLTPSAQPASSHEKKFDHIEIAQRFMDQQRYDKAIETLKRGLIEKPNDSQLSLKLLAVYATIDESDNFNKIYDAIKANSDEKSIAQADELKALLTAEHDQVAKQALPADAKKDAEFESLDFDLPTDKVTNDRPSIDNSAQNANYKNDLLDSTQEISTADNFNDSNFDINDFENRDFDNSEPVFDLSLDDLESSVSDSESSHATDVDDLPVTTFDLADDNVLTPEDSAIENDSNSNDADLDLDFDWSEQSVTPVESTVDVTTHDSVNNLSNELTLDDDFVLDLADLDVDADTEANNEVDTHDASKSAAVANETDIEDTIDINNDRLTLSLDSDDIADETQNASSATEEDFEDFSFEDISTEDANITDISLEETGLIENESEASSMSPTTLRFDDNTLINDDFDFDNLSEPTTESMPVEADSEYATHIVEAIDLAPATETVTDEDFSAQFAADFDFVKSLDSNQVTLDLAGQYLQLGEYDSAKRLLNEVIAQGNNEQQQQAQQLLERTA